ncbi:MAG: hypothetical protein LAQ30_31740, partial [Acidobacteriia bacterium]|nr:hypothetical protein [Terriglobia bacterium]
GAEQYSSNYRLAGKSHRSVSQIAIGIPSLRWETSGQETSHNLISARQYEFPRAAPGFSEGVAVAAHPANACIQRH